MNYDTGYYLRKLKYVLMLYTPELQQDFTAQSAFLQKLLARTSIVI